VASVDRLVRECQQEGLGPGRTALLAELKSAGSAVIWIGETVVCLER
jgi:predicted ATPase